MIFATGIIITLFLVLLLVTKKGKTQADIILVVWLFIIAIHLQFVYFQFNNLLFQYPSILGLSFPLPILQGPFLYLYICSLTSKHKLNYKSLFHFIPFFISIFSFSEYYLFPAETKIEMFKNQEGTFGLIMTLNVIAIKISMFTYIVLSAIRLRNYKRNLKNEFSCTEKINLDWIKYLIIGMAVIWIVIFSGKGDWYIYTAVVLFTIFIGYFGIKQIGIFSQSLLIFEKESKIQTEKFENESSESYNGIISLKNYNKDDSSISKKYQKSPLSRETAIEIHERLKNIMSSEKLFKNEELTLNQLAEILRIHPNYLSQVINTYEKKKFYEYINELRIMSFINAVKLPENKKFTYLSLAYDCGFNSKTSFNRNFKKIMGISPTEYFNRQN